MRLRGYGADLDVDVGPDATVVVADDADAVPAARPSRCSPKW